MREKSHRSVTESGVGGMGVGRVYISRLGLILDSGEISRRAAQSCTPMNTSRSHIPVCHRAVHSRPCGRGSAAAMAPGRIVSHTVGFRSVPAAQERLLSQSLSSLRHPVTLLSYFFFICFACNLTEESVCR